MAYNELFCLCLFNTIVLTDFQVIMDQQDRCRDNVDDVLMQVRELQLEFSAYRQQSMDTERLLHDRLNKMEQDYSTYRNESTEAERRLQDRIAQLEIELASYRNDSVENQDALEESKRQNETIGFSAYLTLDLAVHTDKPVIYDAVLSNRGSGYNTSTGIFTVPMEGTYVLIWNAVTRNTGTGYCYLYLYRNNSRLQFAAFADSRWRYTGTDSGSNSAVLTLNTGDTLGIRTYGSCGYLYGRLYSSFSGFKID